MFTRGFFAFSPFGGVIFDVLVSICYRMCTVVVGRP